MSTLALNPNKRPKLSESPIIYSANRDLKILAGNLLGEIIKFDVEEQILKLNLDFIEVNIKIRENCSREAEVRPENDLRNDVNVHEHVHETNELHLEQDLEDNDNNEIIGLVEKEEFKIDDTSMENAVIEDETQSSSRLFFDDDDEDDDDENQDQNNLANKEFSEDLLNNLLQEISKNQAERLSPSLIEGQNTLLPHLNGLELTKNTCNPRPSTKKYYTPKNTTKKMNTFDIFPKGTTIFKCPTCNTICKDRKTFWRHYVAKHMDPTYACDYPGCNKQFRMKAKLKTHRRRHEKEVRRQEAAVLGAGSSMVLPGL